jgi:hypothetical protein
MRASRCEDEEHKRGKEYKKKEKEKQADIP